MLHSIAHIAAALLQARKRKGISQRTLSSKTKIPQSHISKIENGTIDLQTSSLIELSRVLDLELMLVPRSQISTFRALLRNVKRDGDEQIPAYRLDEEDEND